MLILPTEKEMNENASNNIDASTILCQNPLLIPKWLVKVRKFHWISTPIANLLLIAANQ